MRNIPALSLTFYAAHQDAVKPTSHGHSDDPLEVGWRGQFVMVILPLLLNLLLALILLMGLPWLFKAPLFGLTYVFPDLGYTLLVGGVIALAWGLVRTVLAYLALRTGSTRAKRVVSAPVSGALKP